MEMGNKEGVKEMRALVDEQKGLLGQLDALRQTRSQVLRQGNLDS
jgi:cell shape-determining protein MreC